MKILFGITGSFCCHENALNVLAQLVASGNSVTPVISENAASLGTRFGDAGAILGKVKSICGKDPILTIPSAEKNVTAGGFDIIVLCPCTGNTLGKIASGITDTPVTMSVKAMLRNKKPVVVAFASNDGLSGSMKNIASLMERKNFYFVPLRQDDYVNKPCSLVCDFSLTERTISCAAEGIQIQPMLLTPIKKESR